jgi:hypothetical protein
MPPVVPEKIMINLRLPIGQGMIAMEPSDTVEQVLEKACAKIRRTDPKRKDVPDQYLIKVGETLVSMTSLFRKISLCRKLEDNRSCLEMSRCFITILCVT